MNTPYLDKLLTMSDEELAALEGSDGNRSSRRVGIGVRFIPTESDERDIEYCAGKSADEFRATRFNKEIMERIAKFLLDGIPSRYFVLQNVGQEA